jgi:hypothetical protein
MSSKPRRQSGSGSRHIWKSLIIDVFHVATSSRAPVAVGAPQEPANSLIGTNKDSDKRSQCDEGCIGGSAESEDDEDDAEVAQVYQFRLECCIRRRSLGGAAIPDRLPHGIRAISSLYLVHVGHK